MKYPELWERANQFQDRVVNEVLTQFPIRTNRHRALVSRAASGGSYNNSIRLMAYKAFQEGEDEDALLQIVIQRIKAYYIRISERHQVKSTKEADLEFYRETQQKLGNT
jgi:hypothetical protein